MLPKMWEVPDKIRNRFGDEIGRQRAMFAEGHLVLILHKVPDPTTPKRDGLLFWRKPDGVWSVNTRGAGLSTLRDHVESYWKEAYQLDDAYEDATTPADFLDILEKVAPLERASRNGLDALQSAREAVDDHDLITLRDRAAEAHQTAELVMAEAKAGLEFTIAKQGEAQAKAGHAMALAGHRLNMLIAIFLPLTALGSLFGMNMKNGLEDSPLWGFWVLFGAGIVVGLAIAALLQAGGRPGDSGE